MGIVDCWKTIAILREAMCRMENSSAVRPQCVTAFDAQCGCDDAGASSCNQMCCVHVALKLQSFKSRAISDRSGIHASLSKRSPYTSGKGNSTGISSAYYISLCHKHRSRTNLFLNCLETNSYTDSCRFELVMQQSRKLSRTSHPAT